MDLLRLFGHDSQQPLLFHTGAFFFFFTIFIVVFAVLRQQKLARFGWVLLFSYFYYYKCNGPFMVALLVTTVADYFIANRLHKESRPRVRKLLVTLSVLLGLGILGYFKYTNFFLRNYSWLSGDAVEPISIFLPIGISFYTFQSISYVIDIYRKDQEPAHSLFEYAFYLSFFPQIVAGPIERARVLLPQIRQLATPTPAEVSEGLSRIVQGLVKKALIADYLGLFCDLVFDHPQTYSGIEVTLAIYAYALQIYFDFSGYSDMAIGMARIVGIKLPENFHSPYRATSIREFWRRWHISLSTWLRDYLYIPLGGNRKGKGRQYLNLMLTMLLGGLWHGASWNFVVWGGFHGIGLAVHRFVSERWPAADGKGNPTRKLIGWLITMQLVLALWVFFRAKDFPTAWLMFERSVLDWDWAHLSSVWRVRKWLILTMGLGAVISLVPNRWSLVLTKRFVAIPALAKAVVFLVLLQFVVQVQQSNVQPFIYFQF